MKTNSSITFEMASKLLSYDPDTGLLRWKDRRLDALSKFSAGAIDKHGYTRIRIHGIDYQGHRIAWLLYYGKFPENQIDHINREKSDNRISNLRNTLPQQNCENVFTKERLQGAQFHRPSGKWRSSIGHNYKRIHIGYFDTAIEAHEAYLEKKKQLHAFFAGDGGGDVKAE